MFSTWSALAERTIASGACLSPEDQIELAHEALRLTAKAADDITTGVEKIREAIKAPNAEAWVKGML